MIIFSEMTLGHVEFLSVKRERGFWICEKFHLGLWLPNRTGAKRLRTSETSLPTPKELSKMTGGACAGL